MSTPEQRRAEFDAWIVEWQAAQRMRIGGDVAAALRQSVLAVGRCVDEQRGHGQVQGADAGGKPADHLVGVDRDVATWLYVPNEVSERNGRVAKGLKVLATLLRCHGSHRTRAIREAFERAGGQR